MPRRSLKKRSARKRSLRKRSRKRRSIKKRLCRRCSRKKQRGGTGKVTRSQHRRTQMKVKAPRTALSREDVRKRREDMKRIKEDENRRKEWEKDGGLERGEKAAAAIKRLREMFGN